MEENMYTYTGARLDEALNTVAPERKAIVEGLIYEKSALLLYADDGVGKSVIVMQAALQMTVPDSTLFGELEVPTARNVLHFQMERHVDESFERIKHMRRIIPFDSSKYALSVALQGKNLQDRLMFLSAIKTVEDVIKEAGFIPDVMIFDPIYTMVGDDMSEAAPCNAITSFFRTLQVKYGCSIVATSHTNRGIRDPKTFKRQGKDMYGNRFLSAFFTGSYHIESRDEGAGSIFTRDKNSQSNLEKKFGLLYDPASFCSWIDASGKILKKDKLLLFLRSMKSSSKEFSFEDMMKASGLSHSKMRGHLGGYLKNGLKEVGKLNHGKLLYRYEGT